MRLHLDLLGQFSVIVQETAIPADAWRRERGAALVKLLAVTPGHRLHREQVMELFWPDLDAEAAGANLRKAVHFARRALGEHELIESSDVVARSPRGSAASWARPRRCWGWSRRCRGAGRSSSAPRSSSGCAPRPRRRRPCSTATPASRTSAWPAPRATSPWPLAHELLALAERAGSAAGRALATLMLGELATHAGQLDEAELLLTEAERLHGDLGADVGRAIALIQLAQLALTRGQKAPARALTREAAPLARATWLSAHLGIRVKALEVQVASSPDEALREIQAGDRQLASCCQPCSMAFRTASAIALCEAGEGEQVARRLDEAERLASMWSGGPWAAAVWEARGVLRRAQGHGARANAGFGEAAARYAELGRPLDHDRCLARMNEAAPGA